MIQLKDTPLKVYAIGAELVFIKAAPRSASKLSIDPINSHASNIGKSTGSNRISVLINEPCLLIGTRELFCYQNALRRYIRLPLAASIKCT